MKVNISLKIYFRKKEMLTKELMKEARKWRLTHNSSKKMFKNLWKQHKINGIAIYGSSRYSRYRMNYNNHEIVDKLKNIKYNIKNFEQ